MEKLTLLFAAIGAVGTVVTVYKTLTDGVGAWRWSYEVHTFPNGLRQSKLTGRRIGGGGAYDVEIEPAAGMCLLTPNDTHYDEVCDDESVTWCFDIPDSVKEPSLTVRWRNGVQRWRPLRSKRFRR